MIVITLNNYPQTIYIQHYFFWFVSWMKQIKRIREDRIAMTYFCHQFLKVNQNFPNIPKFVGVPSLSLISLVEMYLVFFYDHLIQKNRIYSNVRSQGVLYINHREFLSSSWSIMVGIYCKPSSIHATNSCIGTESC